MTKIKVIDRGVRSTKCSVLSEHIKARCVVVSERKRLAQIFMTINAAAQIAKSRRDLLVDLISEHHVDK